MRSMQGISAGFRAGKLQIAAFVNPEMHQAVTELAEREKRSVAAIVRRALEHELEKAAA